MVQVLEGEAGALPSIRVLVGGGVFMLLCSCLANGFLEDL